ncbi:glycosyltransferase family 4 protein [Marinobacter koreensis]|uniref:Glycosyltransferase family 4 protein n=1 Tax=Marinobacter koreensis TaxID=335974 RepID=A0ABW0RKH2_9GAMM|nr:glycosyltransferase [Marinobacter koreensis]MCK7546993.1 glycosyltransferase [Marinobacter koreensis]
MTKKVVHIITGLNDGGAEGVLARLCLHSEQVQHVVISLMDEGKYGPLLGRSGVTVHCLGMNPGKPGIVRLFRLVRLIRAEQPDLVQTWMYHADLLGGIAAKLAGVRRVFWGIRHSTLEKGKSKRSTIMIARLCALLSSWVPNKIICCATKARDVHADIGYSPRKLRVIPNGYDLSRFRSDAAAGAKVRAELGLGQNDFIIGSVGRFDPLKDHSNLLRALVRVAESKIPFCCLLIGKGLSPDNLSLAKHIAELGLQDRVLLLGQRPDVPAVMNALDLHILSSSSEGFPNVIAEAMACGTPCVSTDVGDALEILGDQEACCPARDPQALGDLIIKLAQEWVHSPSEWQARKVASSRRISEKFSIDAMVEAYEACWFHAACD